MGEHEYNKRGKSKELKPKTEVVVVLVPPIIEKETFDAVKKLLKACNPKVTPSRVISGPTMLTGLIHCAKCGGTMTIRTGKGGRYRYYACSMKARQGPTACEGMAVPMEKLDDLVARHLEEQLLQLERLETVLAAALDRREEHGERRREHIAELNERAAESELRLKRLYDAIEAGVADLDDPALKDRIDGLKAIRDQARIDAERAQAMLQNSGSKAVTPQMLNKFASTARQCIRLEGGGSPPVPAASDRAGHRAAGHLQHGLGAALSFSVALNRPDHARRLAIVHQPRKLPLVLSVEEVTRRIEAAPGPTQKATLGTASGQGGRWADAAARRCPKHNVYHRSAPNSVAVRR